MHLRNLPASWGGKPHATRKLSSRSVQNYVVTLGTILNRAVRNRIIDRSPSDGKPRLPKDSKVVRPWKVDEVLTFCAALDHEERAGALLLLIAMTGVRKGEALGVPWRDIDLDTGEMWITQSLVKVDGNKLPTLQSNVKTEESESIIPLPPDVVAALRRWRAFQSQERLLAGAAWKAEFGADLWGGVDTDLVFTDPLGGAIKPDWPRRQIVRIAAEVGLRRSTIHDLRHAFITNGLTSGIPLGAMSELARHSSVQITKDTYGHFDNVSKRYWHDEMMKRVYGR